MEEKYRLVWTYDQIFSRGMKRKWSKRVYVDLFAGPGRVRFEETGMIYPGSPMLALAVKDPFTKYIFCDQEAENIDVLRQRVRTVGEFDVHYLCGDANQLLDEILRLIPQDALAFTFLDPFKIAQLPFDTVTALARRRTDFLILLPTGIDIIRRLNEWSEPDAKAIGIWAGAPEWRKAWIEKPPNENDRQFLARLYAGSMNSQLRYRLTPIEKIHAVLHRTKNYPLYHLAFFSRHRLGYQFWDETLLLHSRVTPQFSFFDA